jgi:S-adenosylmethionine synthetase
MRKMIAVGGDIHDEDARNPADSNVESGLKITIGGGRTVTLSGLTSYREVVYGFSVAHGFPEPSGLYADVRAIGSGKIIGSYGGLESLNLSNADLDIRDYLRFFRVAGGVKCESFHTAEIGRPLHDVEITANAVLKVMPNGRRMNGTIERIDASTYIKGLGHSAEFQRTVGGILIRPEGSIRDFVKPGDSGSLVLMSTGQPIGVIVARDDELVLVAPIKHALERRHLSILDHESAARWSKPLPSRGGGMRSNYRFTSESVSEGNADKISDRISDEIVDLVYREALKCGINPASVRVSCETLVTTNRVVIAGEARLPPSLLKYDSQGRSVVNPSKFKAVVRKAIRDIGYEQEGFHWRNAKVDLLMHSQSLDIAQGVDSARFEDEGAGDQGIMFGYACRETPDLMPAPIYYSHRILQFLAAARKKGEGDAAKLGPDGKAQVTVRYENGIPVFVDTIVLSIQHLDEQWDSKKVREVVEPYVRDAIGSFPIHEQCEWHINPTGKFVIGGPDSDAGATGRKTEVDTYGGAVPNGGGAFSGRDARKLDRSAAYAARYLAKNVVAAGLSDSCTIQLSYSIGVAQPLSVYVDLHGTGNGVTEDEVETAIRNVMDLSPYGIRKHLDLSKPIYAKTATYGHFGRKAGRDGSFSWERLDLARALKRFVRSSSLA